MSEKNILITGASGFIGSALVAEAIKRGLRAHAGIRASSSRENLDHPAINFVTLDLNDPVAMGDTLHQFKHRYGRPDFIIHAAGITKALHRLEYWQINFERTRDLVEILIREEMVPDRFIYISSLSSFGPGKSSAPITLQQEQDPLSDYGKSKRAAEQYLWSLPDFPFVILNPTAVYGPRDKGFLLVVKSIKRHLEVRIAGAGQQLSFLHVDDLCQAAFLCLESWPLRRQYLVSDLKTYTEKDFNDIVRSRLHTHTWSLILPVWVARKAAWVAETTGRVMGKAVLLNRDRFPEFAAANWAMDGSEITELGFQPMYDLPHGLDQTVRWYQSERWI
jgi:UDP-glucose 4-epimerase